MTYGLLPSRKTLIVSLLLVMGTTFWIQRSVEGRSLGSAAMIAAVLGVAWLLSDFYDRVRDGRARARNRPM